MLFCLGWLWKRFRGSNFDSSSFFSNAFFRFRDLSTPSGTRFQMQTNFFLSSFVSGWIVKSSWNNMLWKERSAVRFPITAFNKMKWLWYVAQLQELWQFSPLFCFCYKIFFQSRQRVFKSIQIFFSPLLSVAEKSRVFGTRCCGTKGPGFDSQLGDISRSLPLVEGQALRQFSPLFCENKNIFLLFVSFRARVVLKKEQNHSKVQEFFLCLFLLSR